MSISKIVFFEILSAISALQTALATILKRATVAFFGAPGSAAIRHVRRSTFTAACIVARRHSQSGRLSSGSLLTSVFRPSISAPSLRGLPVLRRSAHQSLLAQVSKMRHTGTQSHQTSGAVSVANVGALTPNSIQFGGISSTVAPCVGLTYWSRGRLYFRSLRQSHAGAPYRGR